MNARPTFAFVALLIAQVASLPAPFASGSTDDTCVAEYGFCTQDSDCCAPNADGNTVACQDNNGQKQCQYAHTEAQCGTGGQWYKVDQAGCCEAASPPVVYDFTTHWCGVCSSPVSIGGRYPSSEVSIASGLTNYPNALKTDPNYSLDESNCGAAKPWCDMDNLPKGVYGCQGHTNYCVAPGHWNCEMQD